MQIGCGAHLASYSLVIRSSFPRQGAEPGSPPYSPEVKNGCNYISTPHTFSWCGACLHQGQFYLLLLLTTAWALGIVVHPLIFFQLDR
jgi:hypothetical protein